MKGTATRRIQRGERQRGLRCRNHYHVAEENIMKAATALRIAVADDEPEMRQFFQELLPTMGHQVVGIVSTGAQLVECCRQQRPDVVITDIKMPDMDGIDAAAAVNHERNVPVVLVSGHTE